MNTNTKYFEHSQYITCIDNDKHSYSTVYTSPPHLHHLSAHNCPHSCEGKHGRPRLLRPSCLCSAWSWSCASSCCSGSPHAPHDSSDTSLRRSWGGSGIRFDGQYKGVEAVHSYPSAIGDQLWSFAITWWKVYNGHRLSSRCQTGWSSAGNKVVIDPHLQVLDRRGCFLSLLFYKLLLELLL